MNGSEVTMVRIYLHEARGQVDQLLTYLHDEARIRGVTVFRGISGYGTSGRYHTATLVDLSLDLPVVIEFYEDSERVKPVLKHLDHLVKAGHIVHWPASILT